MRGTSRLSGGGLAGGLPPKAPPWPPNGLVTSERNELIACIPAGAAPVPASPESCVKAAANWSGELKLRRFWNAGGSVPPLATKVSMAFATAISLAVAEGGNVDAAEAAMVLQIEVV